MILTIILTLIVGTMVVDYFAVRRLCRRRTVRRRLFTLLLMFDLMPLITVAFMRLCLTDNTPLAMRVGMWIFTFYLLLGLPRLVAGLLILCARSRMLWSVAALLGAGLFAVLLYSTVVTRAELRTEQVTVEMADLPTAFDGYRIALFSDLHVGALLHGEQQVAAIVTALNAQQPDLTVFAGDLVNIRASEMSESLRQTLARLHATDGVVAVVGNHDTGCYIQDTLSTDYLTTLQQVRTVEHAIGWTVLADSTLYIRRGADSIAVTGIDFRRESIHRQHLPNPGTYPMDSIYASVPRHLTDITVSHLPQLWGDISTQPRPTLTLAGHVHAMQCKIRLFGHTFSPAQIMYKQWSGLYRHGEHALYVNDGIAAVGYYMRIGVQPEITVLTLRKRP